MASSEDRVVARPDAPVGTGVLALAGSSGRLDRQRCELLARHGALATSFRWFGAPGRPPYPLDVPVEGFVAELDALRRECDRVAVVGTSFGAEAALVAATLVDALHAVVAFAPTDCVWGGSVGGRERSHWTWQGRPLPHVPFDASWRSGEEPPTYVELYRRSRLLDEAATTLIEHPGAGHRTVLPGEQAVTGGPAMSRGGSPEADAALGRLAWPVLVDVLALHAG